MKLKRQAKILELINVYKIETQEELQCFLKKASFDVTQATVSRDIKELHLIKISTENGKYFYSQNKRVDIDSTQRGYSILSDSLVSVQSANNFIVIKCIVGAAQVACAAIDAMDLHGLLGTLAGDDTIFAVAKTNEDALFLVQEFSKLIR